LIIDYNEFGEDGIRALAASPLMAQITSLRIDWNPVLGDAGVIAVAESARARNLAKLDLTFEYRLSWLMTYERDQTGFGDDALQALAASPHLTSLQDLILAENNRIRSRGMETLVSSPLMGRLSTLNLKGLSPVHDLTPQRLAEVVASSPQSRNLTTLRLPNNRLNTAAVRALGHSPHLDGLGVLDLTDNPITDEPALALAASPNLKGLTRLILTHSTDFAPTLPPQCGVHAQEALQKRFGPFVCDF
jgi:hypothetical protein